MLRENALKTAAAALCALAALLSFLAGNDAPAATVRAEDGAPMIALTFDDGPYVGVTSAILDVLEEYGVTATFFVLGSRVKGREETLLRMEELGCEIGNHTWSHADLTRLSAADCIAEIERTNKELKRVLGHGAAVVRPPFGCYNSTVRRSIPYPLVLWSIDTNDWKRQNPAQLVKNVVAEARAGCVILMHDQQSSTAAAIKDIIPLLVKEGFQFVTMTEFITARGEEATAIKFPP